MADRYWRGGAGTWNTTSTTNWSTTSGGTGGASVPTAADNVIFDANSGGTFTVTMTGALLCNDITVGGSTVTFATGTTPTLAVSGSMSLESQTVWNSTGAVTFNATSAKTITTNAVNIDAPINFNGVGGSWTLGSNFMFGKTAIRAMTLTNGTIDGGNYYIGSSFASTFSSTTNTNTIQYLDFQITGATTLVSGTLNVLGVVQVNGGSFVHTAGTLNAGSGGGGNFYTGPYTFTAGTLNVNTLTMATGAFTWTAGTINLNSNLTCTTFTSTGTTARTFAFGTSALYCSGGNGTVFNMTGATNQVITGTPNVYITYTDVLGVTVSPGVVTEAQSLNFIFSGGAYPLTFLGTASHVARNITFATGWAGTWNAIAACTIYGSLTLNSTMTITSSLNAMTFGGTVVNTRIITSNTKTIPFPLILNSATNTLQLADALTTSAALTLTTGTFDGNNQTVSGVTSISSTGTVTLLNLSTSVPYTLTSGTLTLGTACTVGVFTFTAGTLALAGFTFTISSMTAWAGVVTRSITFGTGNITVTGTGSNWSQATMGTFSFTGTPNVNFTYASTSAMTVVPGAATEAQSLNFNFAPSSSAAYSLTFLGTASNTVRDVSFSSNFTGTLAATSTCTIYGSLTLSGGMTLTESANAMTFGGAVANTSKTITSAGKAIPFPLTFNSSVSGWTLQDSLAMGATVARALTITAGIFDVNQKPITAGFAGSTMSTNGTVTLRNLWNNTTIPFTLTSGALTVTSTLTNPNDVTHPINSTVSTGTAYISYLNAAFTFTAGTLTLGSDFWITSGSLFTYTAGTIALANFELIVGRMAANGATTRVIQFGTSGKITTTGTGTVWDQTTIGTFSYTGTSKINITNFTTTAISVIPGIATIANAQNFTFWGNASNPYTLTFLATGSHTAGDVIFDSNWTGTWAATGACTIFGNLQIASGVTLSSSASLMTFGATSSKTIISSGKTIPFPITFSGVGGTWTLQDALTVGPTLQTAIISGTLNLNDYVLTTGTFASASATARTIAFGPTQYSGRIVCNYAGASGTVFSTATVTNLTVTGAYPLVHINSTVNSLASNYTVATGVMTEANAMNFWFQGNFTLTFLATASYSCKDIDFGYYGSFNGTWAATSTGTIYGNVLLGPNMTLTTSASAMTWGATSGTKTITSNGKSITFPITINAPSATIKPIDALTMATATHVFTHTAGTFDMNGATVTVGTYATGVGTKSLLFNGSNFYVIGSGATAFNNANPTNYTVGPGGAYGYIFMNSASAKTFVGGGSNFDCYLVNSAAGALTISGASTYTYIGLGYTVLITGSNTIKTLGVVYPSRVLTLTAGTTQTITVSGGWQVSGSSGDLTTINSATAGSLAIIARNYAVNDANYGGHADYVSLKDIQFLPSATTGTGSLPNIWWAGSHSTNLGNNFGVTFTDWSGNATTSIKTYYIANSSITSWTTPADWNPANNTIHMIGAGGGGAGSRWITNTNRAGGGGGGGGGYSRIINYSVDVGTAIPIDVGAGGTAGAAAAIGVSGKTTLFGSSSLSSFYGASFNGTDQYLQMGATFPRLTTGQFLIEAWVYPTSFGTTPFIIEDAYWRIGNNGGWFLNCSTSGVVSFSVSNGTFNSYLFITSSSAIPLNTWSHVAVVRDSSNYITVYANGTPSPKVLYSASLALNSGGDSSTWATRIGCHIADNAVTNRFTGRISNVRIVNGAPPSSYLSSFIPSQSALTNVTGTILLTLNSDTVVDNSTANGGSGYPITNNGATPVATTTGDIYLPAYYAPGGAGGSQGINTTTNSLGGTGGAGTISTGGTGGAGAYSATAAAGAGGGGGGGAAGPLGNGANGGASFATATTASVSGGGGGGNGGGTAGSNGASGVSGKGGNNNSGVGGGATNGAVGTLGGGGASNVSAGAGGVGGTGVDILNTWGGGGGTGGPAQLAATNALAGAYGAGGAGGGVTVATTVAAQLAGGNGGGGLIVIQYYPVLLDAGTPGVGSGFFAFF